MSTVQQAIYYLETWGLTDAILPFIIIFVVIYATLTKAKIFGGGESKRYNVLVSLAIALLVIIPHVTGRYPPGQDVVEIMNKAIPQVSVIALAIIMFLVLVGIFGVEAGWGGSLSGIIVLASIVAIVYIFGNAIGWIGFMPNFLRDPATQALIVMLLVCGIIVWFVTADESSSSGSRLLTDIGNFFRKS